MHQENKAYKTPFLNPPMSYLKDQARMGIFPYLPVMLERYLPPPARLLEIGCEGGRGTLPLQEKGYAMTGVDTALLSMRFGQAQESSKGIDWVNGDALELPFCSNTFDGIILIRQIISLFHGRENRLEILRQIRRLLKPGGYLFISIKNGSLEPGFWHLLHYLYCRIFVYSWPKLNSAKIREIFLRFKQYGQVKKHLNATGQAGRNRDLFITTLVNDEMKANVPYHIYHIKDLIGDLKEAGFQIRSCQDYLEVEKGIKLPAWLRRGSPFLILACQKL